MGNIFNNKIIGAAAGYLLANSAKNKNTVDNR